MRTKTTSELEKMCRDYDECHLGSRKQNKKKIRQKTSKSKEKRHKSNVCFIKVSYGGKYHT